MLWIREPVLEARSPGALVEKLFFLSQILMLLGIPWLVEICLQSTSVSQSSLLSLTEAPVTGFKPHTKILKSRMISPCESYLNGIFI